MAGYIRKLREFMLKTEATKGTAETAPTDGSSSKFLIYDPTFSINGQYFEREPQVSDLSRYQHLVGKVMATIGGRFELRRTNATTTPDEWGKILTCGGFAETTPASNVVYKPTSSLATMKTATAWLVLGSDGTNRVRVGIRGAMLRSVRLTAEIGQPVFVEFELYGAYLGAAKTYTLGTWTVTHETGVPPVFLGAAFTYGGTSVCLSKLSVDMGLDTQMRECANATDGLQHAVIVNRDPSISFDPEYESSSFDPFGDLTAGTARAIAFNVGANLSVSIPVVQAQDPEDGERSGIAIYGYNGKLRRSSGDDEIVITKT